MLPLTHQYGVHDAEAYLLERLGDVRAALQLLCRTVQLATQQLVNAILEGLVTPDALASPHTPLHRASTLVGSLIVNVPWRQIVADLG